MLRSFARRRALLRPVLRVLAQVARGALAFMHALFASVLTQPPNFRRIVTSALLLALGTPVAVGADKSLVLGVFPVFSFMPII